MAHPKPKHPEVTKPKLVNAKPLNPNAPKNQAKNPEALKLNPINYRV